MKIEVRTTPSNSFVFVAVDGETVWSEIVCQQQSEDEARNRCEMLARLLRHVADLATTQALTRCFGGFSAAGSEMRRKCAELEAIAANKLAAGGASSGPVFPEAREEMARKAATLAATNRKRPSP